MALRLHGHFTVATAAGAIIIAMFTSLVILLSLWLVTSYQDAVRRTEERAVAASKIVATNVSWLDSLARQSLRRIDETLGPDIATTAGDEVRNINETVAGLPGQGKAYVVDRAGRTLYSTDPMVKPISIVDRPYFSELARGKDSYVSGLMVSRLNGKQIFTFSHRLERKGQFAGAAVISFDVDLMAPILEAVDLGPNSTVSFARADGLLVARFPLAEGPLDMSQYVLFTDYLPKASEGTYEAISPVDGAHRIVAYRKVEGTDFIALASADYSTGINDFRRNVFVAVSVMVLAAIGSLAAGGWIRHLRRRDSAQSQRLEIALEENRLLLREIHHRVKNNLQSVQSVVRMQQLAPEVQKSLADRISAMIAVHEQIYRQDEFSQLCARDLLKSVVDKLLQAFGSSVEVDFDVDDIAISTDKATPLALVTNEIVTNSLKYAFPPGAQGRISISFKRVEDDLLRLVISDNGSGFDEEALTPGMGTRLIKGLVAQLRGTCQIDGRNGTVFVAELPID